MTIKMIEVDIDKIEFGDRFRQDYGDIDELAESLKAEGFIQPLAVVEVEDSDKPYRLLAGGRRFTAAMKAEIKKVPIRIYKKGMPEGQMRSIELIENIYRKDLTWQEQVKIRREIHELQAKNHVGSMRKTAELLDITHPTLSSDINLAKAMEVIPELAEAPTKGDAIKMLNKAQEGFIREELIKRTEEKKSKTSEDRVKESLVNSYIIDDFFSGMKQIQKGSVDIFEIDPPYGIDLKNVKRLEGKKDSVKSYNEIAKEEYPAFLRKVFKEVYRAGATNSWVIVWFAMEWYSVVREELMNAGFKLGYVPALWIKSKGQTMHNEYYFGNAYEPFLYARKGDANLAKEGHLNVFQYKGVPDKSKIHPTERPIEMIQDVLTQFVLPGNRLCVPFLGSGNTLLAANNMGISAFGFDNNSEYKDKFKERVYTGELYKYSSYVKKEE